VITKEEVSNRVLEYSQDIPIPPNQVLVLDEYRRVADLIERYKGYRSSTKQVQDAIKMVVDLGLKYKSALADLRKLTNPTTDAAKAAMEAEKAIQIARDFDGQVNRVLFDFDTEFVETLPRLPSLSTPPPERKRKDPSAYHAELQEALKAPDLEAKTDAVVATAKEKLEKVVKDETEMQASVEGLIKKLEARREKLIQELSKKSSQSSLRENLWVLLLIICLFSLVVIVVVRWFEVEIQKEWVASGQVIQFVTVSILLTVVVTLGVLDVLKENTLGTLLGGLAGYVLAQGVGRSAAREAVRAGQQAVSDQQTGAGS
jgi:hypothetical protein